MANWLTLTGQPLVGQLPSLWRDPACSRPSLRGHLHFDQPERTTLPLAVAVTGIVGGEILDLIAVCSRTVDQTTAALNTAAEPDPPASS